MLCYMWWQVFFVVHVPSLLEILSVAGLLYSCRRLLLFLPLRLMKSHVWWFLIASLLPHCWNSHYFFCPIGHVLKESDGRERHLTSHIPGTHQMNPRRGRHLCMVLKISWSNYGSHHELHPIKTVQRNTESRKRSETIPGLLRNTSKCRSKICGKRHDVSLTLRRLIPIRARIKKQICWTFFLGKQNNESFNNG